MGLARVWGQSGQVSGWGHYLGQQPAGAESGSLVSDRGEKYGLDVIIPFTDPISSSRETGAGVIWPHGAWQRGGGLGGDPGET